MDVGDELESNEFIQALPFEITPILSAVNRDPSLGTLTGEIVPYIIPSICKTPQKKRNTKRHTKATVSIGTTAIIITCKQMKFCP